STGAITRSTWSPRGQLPPLLVPSWPYSTEQPPFSWNGLSFLDWKPDTRQSLSLLLSMNWIMSLTHSDTGFRAMLASARSCSTIFFCWAMDDIFGRTVEKVVALLSVAMTTVQEAAISGVLPQQPQVCTEFIGSQGWRDDSFCFTSPFYPAQYPNNTDCIKVIQECQLRYRIHSGRQQLLTSSKQFGSILAPSAQKDAAVECTADFSALPQGSKDFQPVCDNLADWTLMAATRRLVVRLDCQESGHSLRRLLQLAVTRLSLPVRHGIRLRRRSLHRLETAVQRYAKLSGRRGRRKRLSWRRGAVGDA
uniref:CUB domain-containing protein n=1 Tax=Macrostomum lignano TaxID=282301 RepID=A0A1I8IX21_9PLAT